MLVGARCRFLLLWFALCFDGIGGCEMVGWAGFWVRCFGVALELGVTYVV